MSAEQSIPKVKLLLANVAIVLVHPKYAENIGAAARVAHNMGVSRLIVITDQAPDRERMRTLATHHAAHLVENLELYSDLATALTNFSYVVGTTARHGRQRLTVASVRELAATLFPILAENCVALLFGAEDRGLTNDDLQFCNLAVTIPTSEFSSLNLAQAVAIICHELYTGITELTRDRNVTFSPRMATVHETEGMYGHIAEVLGHIGFFKEDDADYWMRAVRKFLGRLGLRAKETRLVRGICRQYLWHEQQKRRLGIEEEKSIKKMR